LPGETIIPRNYGQAPGAFVVNFRISRAFAFGVIHHGNAAAAKSAGQTAAAPAAGPGGGARTAPVGPGGPAPGGAGAAASEKRYNLNVSINFQNLLNHVNLGTPVGNLSSPSFGESVNLGGAFGGFGGAPGSTGAGNRRIYVQVRLNF
jgi:hypothetical protein